MPRMLDEAEKEVVLPHYSAAGKIALESDCDEAQFGAVIFEGKTALAKGVNHVPPHLKHTGTSCTSHCPRFGVPQLKGGVGAELCFVIHAEQDAVNKLSAFSPGFRDEHEQSASMVIARMKNRKEVIPVGTINVRCTECSKKIANETKLKEIVFPVQINGKMEFIAYDRVEFHTQSVKNLSENWKAVLDVLGKKA